MKIWIGITDRNWFDQLKSKAPEEVNFWLHSPVTALNAPGCRMAYFRSDATSYVASASGLLSPKQSTLRILETQW